MLPRVILFNAVSLDGRIDWFPADQARFYSLAATWKEDGTLVGSDTILAAGGEFPPEDETAFTLPENYPGDTRPVLAIPDSRGRVRSWHALKQWGYWRDFVALCSRSTPAEYLEYLAARHIGVIMAGEDRVDFSAALEELGRRYGVTTLRVDSGGTLNGVLLRAGLVHEVSALVHPSLVGGVSPRSMYRAPDLESPDGVIPLELIDVQKVEGGLVWSRYAVRRR